MPAATAPFNTADMDAILGNYFREHTTRLMLQQFYQPGQFKPNQPDLYSLLEMEPVWDEKTWGEVTYSMNVQDADNSYNDQGDVVELNGRIMKVFRMRSDFKLKWRGLYRKWMNHITQQGFTNTWGTGQITAQALAFADNVLQGLVQVHNQNLRLRTAMKGQHVNNFVYAQSYGAAADGINKLIRDAILAGLIPANQVVASGGALGPANTYDHFEAMGKATTPQMDGRDLFLITATENSDNYNDGFQAAHPGANERIHDSYDRVRLKARSNVAITPTREADGEDLSFIMPRGAIMMGKNFGDAPPEILTAVDDPETIKVSLFDSIVFAIARHDYLVVNDQ